MKLEVGKRYVTRSGRVTKPFIECDEFTDTVEDPDTDYVYLMEGEYNTFVHGPSWKNEDDLIKEYVEKPLTIERAVQIVDQSMTVSGRLEMESEDWAQIAAAYRMLAEEYIKVRDRIPPA